MKRSLHFIPVLVLFFLFCWAPIIKEASAESSDLKEAAGFYRGKERAVLCRDLFPLSRNFRKALIEENLR